MKNILSAASLEEITDRINSLNKNESPLWGKMTVHEMICHCADQIKLSTGALTSDFVGNYLTASLMKRIILLGLPTPKGKIETTKELKQGVGGTKPIDFSSDRDTLLTLLKSFGRNFNEGKEIVHPAFGKMNKKQWSRLVYLHTDHHLKQFGK